MSCKYDREADAYLIDGEPCRRDEYGDPTYHCTARRTCSMHVGKHELTCARCVGRTRQDIRQVTTLSALMMPMAITEGVNSEAANLAGPAADYSVFSARRAIDRRWIVRHLPSSRWEQAMRNLLADDDEWHPYSLLTRWQLMLSEDYDHPLPDRMTITDAGAYLERHLHRIAQDAEQDFPLLAREIRKCRSHLESVLHNSGRPEQGAFCPTCRDEHKTLVRLAREYGHWCEDDDCAKIHYSDDSGDVWRCPRNKGHWWTQQGYSEYMQERQAAG